MSELSIKFISSILDIRDISVRVIHSRCSDLEDTVIVINNEPTIYINPALDTVNYGLCVYQELDALLQDLSANNIIRYGDQDLRIPVIECNSIDALSNWFNCLKLKNLSFDYANESPYEVVDNYGQAKFSFREAYFFQNQLNQAQHILLSKSIDFSQFYCGL